MKLEQDSIWRHHKGGYYGRVGVVTHEGTGEQLALYMRIGEPGAKLWVRPLDEWEEEIGGVPRFVRASSDEVFEVLAMMSAQGV